MEIFGFIEHRLQVIFTGSYTFPESIVRKGIEQFYQGYIFLVEAHPFQRIVFRSLA